jgi:hypothetical protein
MIRDGSETDQYCLTVNDKKLNSDIIIDNDQQLRNVLISNDGS